MPGGDRTGPLGMGPMTGRGAGYCGGFPAPGYMNPMPGRGWGWGRGWGRGRGGGRGWGRWNAGVVVPGAPPAYSVPPYDAPYSAEHEMQALRGQAEHLERALGEIRKRITDLEANPPQQD